MPLVLGTRVYQNVSNKSCKFVKIKWLDLCGFSPRNTVNYTILSSLNMLNVEDRVNHVLNIFHDISPSYLKEILSSEVQTQEDRTDPVQI